MRGVKTECDHLDLCVTVASNLKYSQHCDESVKKANRMDLIFFFFLLKNKNVVLPLYNKFVRPYLEYAAQYWFLSHEEAIAKLDLQRRATKMIPSNSARKSCHVCFCFLPTTPTTRKTDRVL